MIEPEHGRVKGAVIDTLQAAREDYDAVVKLTGIWCGFPAAGDRPLRAGAGVHGGLAGRARPVMPSASQAGGATVALTCEVPGGRPGPRFVLDACLDTPPFGDEAAWTYPPASGQITRGWPQR